MFKEIYGDEVTETATHSASTKCLKIGKMSGNKG
jgi:hypothetical protein